MKKLSIVGGGILGGMQALFAYLNALKNGDDLVITIYEKNANLSQTTTANIVPSLTANEITEVVPPAHILLEKLGILFNEPGGIRVDIPQVNNSTVAKRFIQEVFASSQNEATNQKRYHSLLEMGKMSMQMWQRIYDEAPQDFKAIMEQANFKPCHEKTYSTMTLNDGYRIDILNKPGALAHAQKICDDYQRLGFKNCKLLTPSEALRLDPFLSEFCKLNGGLGSNTWRDDVAVVYRPGGCIDTEIFLPLMYDYLAKKMGTYTNQEGKQKPRFRIKFDRLVDGIVVDRAKSTLITGLQINQKPKHNKHAYSRSDYVFCPGEKVGTLSKLGLEEPAYSGFSGASLKLNIPVPEHLRASYEKFNHCMEVYRDGVVLAWQGRYRNNSLSIGVAGSKAYYGDVSPKLSDPFAKDRNLLQLNMINEVLPQMMSLALNRDTTNQELTEQDLLHLESKGIAKRWIGTRALAADGFPSLGQLYLKDGAEINNAIGITHAGSGGVSFAPALVYLANKHFSDASKRYEKGAAQMQKNDLEEELCRQASFKRLRP